MPLLEIPLLPRVPVRSMPKTEEIEQKIKNYNTTKEAYFWCATRCSEIDSLLRFISLLFLLFSFFHGVASAQTACLVISIVWFSGIVDFASWGEKHQEAGRKYNSLYRQAEQLKVNAECPLTDNDDIMTDWEALCQLQDVFEQEIKCQNRWGFRAINFKKKQK